MWDKLYQENEEAFGRYPNDFLLEALEFLKRKSDLPSKKSALVLACGQGRNAFHLARTDYDVVAIDKSKVAIDQAKHRAKNLNLQLSFLHDDLLKLEKYPKASLILWVWFHAPEGAKKEVFRKVHQSLDEGGVFIFEGLREENQNYKNFGPPTKKLLFQLSELLEEFKDYQILIAQEIDRELKEGAAQSGMAAVVQFLVKKPGV
ncbi:MAG: class I SAM-dependent methyltransferase [Bdellovibrionota bacterium]|nr:class I SAM-dependent methyltransferase [Bdellovibrionota bacterium]